MPIAPVPTGQVSYLLHRLRRHDHAGIADDLPVSTPFVARFRATNQTINTGTFVTVQFDDHLVDPALSGLGILGVSGSRVQINKPGTYLVSWRVTIRKTDNNPIDTNMAIVVGVIDYLNSNLSRIYVASQVENQQIVPTDSNYRDPLSVGATTLIYADPSIQFPHYLSLDVFVRAGSLSQVSIVGNTVQRKYTHLDVVRVDGRTFS